jgi:hypothetical protein
MRLPCHHRRVVMGMMIVWTIPAVVLAGPKLYVEQPMVDMGTIKQGEQAECKFVVENRGDEPLEIKSVQPSCGCTTMPLREDQRIVPPGKSVELVARFNSKGKANVVTNRVTVNTNDPTEPKVDLRFKVTIDVLFTVTPPALNFQKCRRGEEVPVPVVIMPGPKNATLELVELKSELGGVEVITEPNSNPNAGKTGFQVKIRIREEAPLGTLATTLVGKAKIGEKEEPIQVPVRGQVIGDVDMTPSFIVKPTLMKRDGRLGEITIKANNDATVVVKAAVPRNRLIDAEVVEKEANKEFRVNLSLAKDAPGGPIATTVDIFTNARDLPVASVPVFVNVESSVTVAPMSVYLTGSGQSGGKRTVKLISQEAAPLKVESVQCDDPDITTRLIPDPEKAQVVQVEVALKENAKPGDHNTTLKVKTNVPGADLLMIPVRAVSEETKKASIQ